MKLYEWLVLLYLAYRTVILARVLLAKRHTLWLTSAESKWVYDGDTLTVLIKNKKVCLRLYAIDSPEADQRGGDAATDKLLRLIWGQKLYLKKHGKDKYNRTLATVYTFNGKKLNNINHRMVASGHAWVTCQNFYEQLSNADKREINRLEAWARDKKLGLWKEPNPTPPWVWRDKKSA